MSKKLLTSVVAALSLSVPFAGIAAADPTTDNPGLPGNIDGISPGSLVRELAQVPGQSTPETVYEVTGGRVRAPGQDVKRVAPSIPGNLDGTAPGSTVRELAQTPNESTPESVDNATEGRYRTPGAAISNIAHDK
ncbi:hypothetical protein [Mycolicibacterium litorale]|uniref:Uncharacterized protein n=1 Tax=Mycolicibacterium litorale TaxID=758802 RepID=A0AAD1MX29_9MYCO|nr:hypothetical protein [Mycolicibacterium litorale]MCV7417876.1 hypothetical protein [Mycolicibacterium litorale]TDY06736.1 hypothetical protein BCL50_3066 [Mycolicibacterium litorale]BBY19111.1 hypothetical protein MLIT_47030 [Mycolicibacterium litorale]